MIRENGPQLGEPNYSFPLEDRAMKMAAQFFGKELLTLLGIKGRIKRIAPTEQVNHKMNAFYEDFNFEMEDGTWHHFEFESDNITKEDLRRFRVYEATTSYDYQVDVVTNVLCSSSVRQLRSELRQGLSVFRISYCSPERRECGSGDRRTGEERKA